MYLLQQTSAECFIHMYNRGGGGGGGGGEFFFFFLGGGGGGLKVFLFSGFDLARPILTYYSYLIHKNTIV